MSYLSKVMVKSIEIRTIEEKETCVCEFTPIQGYDMNGNILWGEVSGDLIGESSYKKCLKFVVEQEKEQVYEVAQGMLSELLIQAFYNKKPVKVLKEVEKIKAALMDDE